MWGGHGSILSSDFRDYRRRNLWFVDGRRAALAVSPVSSSTFALNRLVYGRAVEAVFGAVRRETRDADISKEQAISTMNSERELLEHIKALVGAKRYRVRIHAVRHMIEEGFSEEHLLEALFGKSRVLEDYPDESRCLVLGYFSMDEKLRSPLHIACNYSNDEVIDFITAYIPQKPWWQTPARRGRKL